MAQPLKLAILGAECTGKSSLVAALQAHWQRNAAGQVLGRDFVDDDTDPSERGQGNSATFASLGARYDVGRGLSVLGSVNAVWYRRKGLAPLSMPAHDAFSNVDSRVANRGNWVSLEANYRF